MYLMESEHLRDLCRLCGQFGADPKSRKPHAKEKYGSLILRALRVGISLDDETIHPPFVCHGCVKKLQKWWANAKKKKAATCHIQVHDFKQDTDAESDAHVVLLEEKNLFSALTPKLHQLMPFPEV